MPFFIYIVFACLNLFIHFEVVCWYPISKRKYMLSRCSFVLFRWRMFIKNWTSEFFFFSFFLFCLLSVFDRSWVKNNKCHLEKWRRDIWMAAYVFFFFFCNFFILTDIWIYFYLFIYKSMNPYFYSFLCISFRTCLYKDWHRLTRRDISMLSVFF